MAGIFNSGILTDSGKALLAKAQAGECTIAFTKAAAGSGTYDNDDLQSVTSLMAQEQEFDLSSITIKDETSVCASFTMTNNPDSGALEEGYYVKEIGLFATDPDDGEILYAIATAIEDQWDYMPAYDGSLATLIMIDFIVEVSNASDVTITSATNLYTRYEQQQFLSELTAWMDEFSVDEDEELLCIPGTASFTGDSSSSSSTVSSADSASDSEVAELLEEVFSDSEE